MSTLHKQVTAKVYAVRDISDGQKIRMLNLMEKYYANVNRESFYYDLHQKDHVILLLNRRTRFIEGFSTLKVLKLRQDGKNILGVFSGDTVLEREFWGSRALGVRFLIYLANIRIRHLLTPLYWFLISKGYKTYLLMANNFAEHYPRFDQPIPEKQKKIMNEVYTHLFGSQYESLSGLVKPVEGAHWLREQVAVITPALHRNNPKVAFFAESNPLWERGHELCCLARMSLWMPFTYTLKSILRLRGFRKSHYARQPLIKKT